ncbi:MAG TPA: TonB-dependent receptor [Acetobacteraceae bacterium]|nr:TonB-dependent receptor [Acetobacteraceae bacterium]
MLLAVTNHAAAQGAVNAGEVSATGTAGAVAGTTAQPTQEQVFKSGQTVRVLDRQQMDAAGPVAGAAQILSYTPGANVTGYGNTGASKYTIMLNGLNQGWGGYGGYTADGLLGVTFDGVPVVDPLTGLWQSPTIPQTSMIQNTTVTYGPGDPVDRWYTNVGGSVEFTPLQPTAKPGGDMAVTYGSNDQRNISFDLRTGSYHGWSTILAGGAGEGNSFRTGPDGFANPNHDYAIYLKTVKTFNGGDFTLGGYYANSGGYRPQVIPKTANPAITINGLPGATPYSQQTSGFYSTPAFDSYEKNDFNRMMLVYGRENFQLDADTTLHNLTWYMRLDRLHSRQHDVYNLGPQQDEWNDPHTNVFGDKLWLTEVLPYNTVDVGAYYIHGLYNSRQNFYNPDFGGDRNLVNIGGKIRSSYYDEDQIAAFVQDDINPIPMLHITPGFRVVNYDTQYSNSVSQDFNYAPGVVLSSHCPSTLASTPGNTADQSASCGNHQARTGVEPSIDVTLQPLSWLTVYGGYLVTQRAPEVGGGGGLFQSVDPGSYKLALGQYYQLGFKVHVDHAGVFNKLLFGAAYYHIRYAKQEIDTTLGNGDTISANGTSVYNGVNMFLDDDPIDNLHLFANANIEAATYSSFVTGGVSYNGTTVPYVPRATLNVGTSYDITRGGVLIEPRAWYQYVGTQHVFDNSIGAPSGQTMASYGTFNLALKTVVPLNLGGAVGIRYMDFDLTMLNVLNKQYNEYEYISSGAYFGTPTGGYTLAYPGAPFTVYGTIGVHF